MVRSTDDPMVKDIGEPGIVVHGGDSPSYLLTRTIGDQLKAIEKSARVYSVGLPARAAVLLGGHAADGAFWFDLGSGQFVTSSYYPSSLLHTWVSNFNAQKPCARFNGVSWTAMHPIAKEEPFFVGRESSCFLIAERTPFPDEIVEDFAEELVKRENLGARQSGIDMLFVDLSSSDIMGHAYGPNSAQLHDVCLRIDGLLGRLLNLVDRTVGRDRTIIVLASDHGMAPLPEESVQVRLDAGRLHPEDLQDSVSAQLTKRFEGSQGWISQSTSDGFYLNSNLIQKAGFGEGEVMKSLVAALSQVPHVLRVYSGEQLIARDIPKDSISQRVLNGFYATRSPDLVFIPEPYWQISSSRRGLPAIPTTHGSPFEYDSHIPIVFVGPSIKHGEYTVRASLNDVAPTLAALLEIEAPSGSDGKSLINVIEKQH